MFVCVLCCIMLTTWLTGGYICNSNYIEKYKKGNIIYKETGEIEREKETSRQI